MNTHNEETAASQKAQYELARTAFVTFIQMERTRLEDWRSALPDVLSRRAAEEAISHLITLGEVFTDIDLNRSSPHYNYVRRSPNRRDDIRAINRRISDTAQRFEQYNRHLEAYSRAEASLLLYRISALFEGLLEKQ